MISAIENPRSDYIQSALLCEDEFSLGLDNFYDTYRQRLSGVVSVFKIDHNEISIALICKDGTAVNSYQSSDRLSVHRDIELFKGCSIDIANYQGKVKEVLKVENRYVLDNLKWQIEKPDSMDVVCDSEIKVFGPDDNFRFKHLLTIGEPCVWDSTGKTIEAQWKLNRDDSFELKLWGDIVFPLYIDPSYTLPTNKMMTKILVDSGGSWWVVGCDLVNTATINIVRSQDLGQNWTIVRSYDLTSYVSFTASAILNDVIYVIGTNNSYENTFTRYDTVSDSFIELNSPIYGESTYSIGIQYSIFVGSDGNIHLAYMTNMAGVTYIQTQHKIYNVSTQTWSTPVRISTTSRQHSMGGALEYLPGKLAFCWSGDYTRSPSGQKVCVRCYDYTTQTFLTSELLVGTTPASSYFQYNPQVEYDKDLNRLHVVWMGAVYGLGKYELRYRYINLSNSSMSSVINITAYNVNPAVQGFGLFWDTGRNLKAIFIKYGSVNPQLASYTGSTNWSVQTYTPITGTPEDIGTAHSIFKFYSGYAFISNRRYYFTSDNFAINAPVPAVKGIRQNIRNRRRSV